MPKSLSRRSAFDALLILLTFTLVAGCASTKGVAAPGAADAGKDRVRLNVSWDRAMAALTPPNVTPPEDLSRPSVFDDTLYIGSSLGGMHAVNLKSGATLWTFEEKNGFDAAPSAAGDAVFVGTRDGALVCLDRKTGKERWRFQARSSVLSSALVDGGRLYFSSSDDRLYALDAKTGEKLWSYTRGSYQTVAPRLFSSPAIISSRLYGLFTDGSLVCLAPDTGKELWSKKVVKNFEASNVRKRTPAPSDSSVYLIDDSNSVVELDGATGDQKSAFNLVKARDFSLAEKDGKRLLIVADASQVVAVDRGTGAILWKKELGHTPIDNVFTVNGYIYVLSNFSYAPYGLKFLSRTRGHIEALDPRDGATVWDEMLEYPATAAVTSQGSKMVLLVDYGILQILQSR